MASREPSYPKRRIPPVVQAEDGFGDQVRADLRMLAEPEYTQWLALLTHAAKVGTSPSARWVKLATELSSEIGSQEVLQRLVRWFGHVKTPARNPPADRSAPAPISQRNTAVLRGLLWMCASAGDESVEAVIRGLKATVSQRIPGYGPVSRALQKTAGQVLDARAAGGHVAPPKAVAASAADIERAIAAAPDDPENYLVYGDWLSQQGDPRGELVTVQRAIELSLAERKASNQELGPLLVRERQLLTDHTNHFFGPLSRWRVQRHSQLGWRWGFVHTLGGWFSDAGDAERAFMAHPSARFLRRSLGVAAVTLVEHPLKLFEHVAFHAQLDGDAGVDELLSIATLRSVRANREWFPSLRTARLAALESIDLYGVQAPDLAAACAIIAHSKAGRVRLALDGSRGRASLGPLRDPAISTRVTVLDLNRPEALMPELSRVDLSNVHTLEVSEGRYDEAETTLFRDLPSLPNVKRVVLGWPSELKSYIKSFAESPLCDDLEELSVNLSRPAATRALARATFPRLQRLELSLEAGVSGDAVDSATLFASPALARVHTLRLDPTRQLSELVASPLARQLERLELSVRDDRDARLVVESLPKLERLKELHVDGVRMCDPDWLLQLAALPVVVEWPPLSSRPV